MKKICFILLQKLLLFSVFISTLIPADFFFLLLPSPAANIFYVYPNVWHFLCFFICALLCIYFYLRNFAHILYDREYSIILEIQKFFNTHLLWYADGFTNTHFNSNMNINNSGFFILFRSGIYRQCNFCSTSSCI